VKAASVWPDPSAHRGGGSSSQGEKNSMDDRASCSCKRDAVNRCGAARRPNSGGSSVAARDAHSEGPVELGLSCS
jgi:hypothetical protein